MIAVSGSFGRFYVVICAIGIGSFCIGAAAQTGSEEAAADALFGFGSPPSGASTAKVNGFVDALVAYNYAKPAHWSRAVGRLALNAQGEVADTLKWKIGGRVDVDPVYFTSNFYLDPVKHNQRVSGVWSENYVDFSAGDWDFR